MTKSLIHRRGRRVHVTSMDIESFTEGPSYDPYGGQKYWVGLSNGKMVCLRMGALSGMQLCVKRKGERRYVTSKEARSNAEEQRLVQRFERITGMPFEQFTKLYLRCFYFEDPMGRPSQYV